MEVARDCEIQEWTSVSRAAPQEKVWLLRFVGVISCLPLRRKSKLDMGLAGKSGGGGQLCKLDMGLAGKTGNPPGSGSSLENVRHGLKMRFRR